MKRIALLVITALLGIGAVTAVASEASAQVPAGNGTSNFYLTGSVGHDFPLGVWGACDFTNYDNGSGQTYHQAVRRSGVAVITELLIDGHNYGTATEHFVNLSGHGRHTVGCRFHLLGAAAGYLSSISL